MAPKSIFFLSFILTLFWGCGDGAQTTAGDGSGETATTDAPLKNLKKYLCLEEKKLMSSGGTLVYAEVYDVEGKVVNENNYNGGNLVSGRHLGYDDRGNPVKIGYFGRDKLLDFQEFLDYDDQGRVTTEYRQRTEGRVTEMLSETRYTYNDQGLLTVKEVDWLDVKSGVLEFNFRETYTYNAQGQKTEMRFYDLAEAAETEYSHREIFQYDDRGTLVLRELQRGDQSLALESKAFKYDERGWPLGEQHFNQDGENEMTIAYQYDDEGRVIGEVHGDPSGVRSQVMEREYDAAGRILIERWLNHRGDFAYGYRWDYTFH